LSLPWLPSKVLYVDLTRKRFHVEDRKDLFEKWFGGIGVAIQLYKEETTPGMDPLSPDNPIIFAIGPLSVIFPMASKTITVFKSPLNGYVAESHAGGRLAAAIRFAGYGAVVIKGASDKPLYLVIDERGVKFCDASSLWGMKSTETIGRVLREVTPGSGFRSIIRTGLAGERLVRYANVNVDTYRHFGRMGLGAVFGSKKLKAIVFIGRGSFKLDRKYLAEYMKTYKEIYEMATQSPALKKYHDLGTPQNVLVLNKLGALPTRNFSSGRFEEAEKISGEYLAEKMLGRRLACSGCPVACIHLAALREPTGEPYFYKTTFISYDYELIYALGSNLGIGDPEGMLKLIRAVEEYGLDAISTGVVLAWITEAYEKGVVTKNETIVEPKWGDWATYIKMVEYIVYQPNEFYKTAAMGVKALAEKYPAGKDFAVHIAGVEPAGYHTGPTYWVSLIVGFRHSHLDSAGYSYDEKLAKEGKKEVTAHEIAKYVVEEESWRQVLNSMVLCLFGRGIYKDDVVCKALKSIGIDIDPQKLREIGRRIWLEKWIVKLREGFDPEKVEVPKRILETETPLGKISPELIAQAIREIKYMIYEQVEKTIRGA